MATSDDFELGQGNAVWVPTIGSPAGQVKWSMLLNRVFRAERINAVGTPLDLPPQSLANFLDLVRSSSSIRGFSATIPHKIPLVRLMDVLTPRAVRANAVNVVLKDDRSGRLTGDNIDGMGFVLSLEREGVPLDGRRVLVFGAGGVARAIVASILDRNVGEVAVTDLDATRRQELADIAPTQIATMPLEEAERQLGFFDIVINATPLGMRTDDPLPFDPAGCDAAATLFDCVNAPGGTPLSHRCRQLNRRFVDGAGMLELQLETFLELLKLRPT